MLAFIRALLDAGAVVKFWPDNLYYDPMYAPRLQAMGVEVFHGVRWRDGIGAMLSEYGDEFDAILLSRPDVADAHFDAIRAHSRARVVYYGHDLHFRRMRDQAALSPEGDARNALLRGADTMETRERAIWRRSDGVLYPSDDEAAQVRALEPAVDARGRAAGAYFVTSLRGAPDTKASMLSMSWSATAWRACTLAQATCGVRMKFGRSVSFISG